MPGFNRFHHQPYPTTPVINPVLKTLQFHDGDSGQFADLHPTLQVARVVVVHGTFMGEDPLGVADVLQAMGDSVPVLKATTDRIAAGIRENMQPVTTMLTGDIGNYGSAFRERFQLLVGDDPQVELLEPRWSSQNHHLARADLAVRLIHQLVLRPLPEDQRILFWGHSHAGNAFAILTNLLANETESVNQFFEAAGAQPGAHWTAVRELLKEAPSPHPLASQVLIATFETPVRYGWDTLGCRGLVHVVYHRPFDESHPWLAKPLFPPWSMPDMVNATWGDWVQAFAIAGTDVPTGSSTAANQKLSEVLEAGLAEPVHGLDTRFITPKRVRDACARWKSGTRCHADGHNVLVDYEPSGELTPFRRPIESAFLGHGVATTVAWLPAHLKVVFEHLQLSMQHAE